MAKSHLPPPLSETEVEQHLKGIARIVATAAAQVMHTRVTPFMVRAHLEPLIRHYIWIYRDQPLVHLAQRLAEPDIKFFLSVRSIGSTANRWGIATNGRSKGDSTIFISHRTIY